MGKGSGSVFASKVDLYFKKKSTTNGVNIQLREVVNGYPSAHIIPFSEVHLTSSQVSVTDDASTATTVDFEAPVRLDVDKEYAVVIKLMQTIQTIWCLLQRLAKPILLQVM